MKRRKNVWWAVGISACMVAAGCGEKTFTGNGAPPPTKVEKEADVSLLTVEHTEQFPLVKATEYTAAPTLNVTGVVMPDISRTVPVISLATGRVVEIKARLVLTPCRKGKFFCAFKVQTYREHFPITGKPWRMKR